MIRVIILSIGLALTAATAFAQAPAVEKLPEKPAVAPASGGSSAAPTTTATPQRAKAQNNDGTRDELTKKLECRKQLLRQEQNKNRPQAAPPPPAKK
jgi:hypothetical protein